MKLYVIVRSNLSKSQQAVQAGHAVAQFLLENRETEWSNGTLVYLKSRSLRPYLRRKHTAFFEPDIGNEMTAIATLDSKDLGSLPLM